ncbi:hypothetical protein EK21DRAFT_102390 [Setomelanomma holmii]|uniref:Spherulin-4 n=1 Tax=Setomelanomma holmii TaxID=210430 RepID=A0A9P4H552_9PLEO|nr:hypothetical protein EK21DRAFT_102390 [Setomelanomma holmii]
MSLATPHIQALSTYRTQHRVSSSNRNVSSPFNLAIPPRSQRRPLSRADTPTGYLGPPSNPPARTRTPYLEVPGAAVVVGEKPVQPRLYTLNGGSTDTLKSITGSYEPKIQPKEVKRVNDRVLAIAVTLGLAVILAIGIPLAAVLPVKYAVRTPVKVLVRLFVDPVENGWQKLDDAILKYHDMDFMVVVDPDHGTTNATWPSATFIDGIRSLNIYPNVRTLGYIDTARGTIPNTTIRAQIATYAGWANVTEGLAIHGVCFDATPFKNTDDGIARAYLRNISAKVRHVKGWAGEGEGLVVHNPGRVPNTEMLTYRPDIMVAFEGDYAHVPNRSKIHAQVADKNGGREDYAMLVHSVPKDLGRGGMRRIVKNVRSDVQWFVERYPELNFLVIVNPDSGPGAAPWWQTNQDYPDAISDLKSYSKVQTVGYVRATYCNRPIDDVLQDIDTYASREVNGEQDVFQGIFLDETVNVFSPDVKAYLDRVDDKIKGTNGISDNRITIHNPGTAVSKQLASPGPDITVVVETSYDEFVKSDYQNWLKMSTYDRSRTCYMLYSVPQEKIQSLTAELSDKAKYLFLTSATTGVYESFNGPSWEPFVAAMAGL